MLQEQKSQKDSKSTKHHERVFDGLSSGSQTRVEKLFHTPLFKTIGQGIADSLLALI